MAKLSLLALVSTLLVATVVGAMLNELSCQEAVATVMPCIDYLKGGPEKPSAPCCLGIQKLNTECALRPNRVKICQCLKEAAPKFGVNPERVKNLPSLCSVHLPFEISPGMDCSKISH